MSEVWKERQEEQRRNERKAFAFSKIQELTTRRDESKESAEQLVSQALEPLRDSLPASSNLAVYPNKMRGQWNTLFSHFGARHTAGIMPPCATSLRRLSFGSIKSASPITLVNTLQEIEPNEKSYNNIMVVESNNNETGERVTAYLILYGRYEMETTPITTNPADGRHHEMNLLVSFYQIELVSSPQCTEAQLRAAFGIDTNDNLRVSFPRVHAASSRVVYLDNDTRVMYGSVGGIYVLQRTTATSAQGISTSFGVGDEESKTKAENVSMTVVG